MMSGNALRPAPGIPGAGSGGGSQNPAPGIPGALRPRRFPAPGIPGAGIGDGNRGRESGAGFHQKTRKRWSTRKRRNSFAKFTLFYGIYDI